MNKIKYFIIAAAILIANSAIAGQVEVDAVVVKVVPQYSEVQVNTPIRTCNIVEVPIYGNTGKTQTGEVLGGAIIGGILGNQVGGGKGKDAATILGAILGADFANKKSGTKTIVGYKRTTVCEDNPTFVTENRSVYEYSIVRVTDANNNLYDVRFIAENK
jgi:uncharacterized protein YcfJ